MIFFIPIFESLKEVCFFLSFALFKIWLGQENFSGNKSHFLSNFKSFAINRYKYNTPTPTSDMVIMTLITTIYKMNLTIKALIENKYSLLF